MLHPKNLKEKFNDQRKDPNTMAMCAQNRPRNGLDLKIFGMDLIVILNHFQNNFKQRHYIIVH
jgi:hypothetical protein